MKFITIPLFAFVAAVALIVPFGAGWAESSTASEITAEVEQVASVTSPGAANDPASELSQGSSPAGVAKVQALAAVAQAAPARTRASGAVTRGLVRVTTVEQVRIEEAEQAAEEEAIAAAAEEAAAEIAAAAAAAAAPACPAGSASVGGAPARVSALGVSGTTSDDMASFAAQFNAIRSANCLEPVVSIFYDSCMEDRLFWMAESPSPDPLDAWGHAGSVRIDGVPSVGCDGNLAGGSGNTGDIVATKWWDSQAHRESLYRPGASGAGACIAFAMTHGGIDEPYSFVRAAARWVSC